MTSLTRIIPHLLCALLLLPVLILFKPAEKVENQADGLNARETEFNGQDFYVVSFSPDEAGLSLFWKNEGGDRMGSFEELKTRLKSEGRELLFATNAGIFSDDFTPGGLHIENGRQLSPLNLKTGKGNFHLMPNGVFYLGAEGAGVMESHDYQAANLRPRIATQSGPALVLEGEFHPAFRKGSKNKYIRNGVGVDQEGNIYFALSRKPVNFFDFASLFRDKLGCPNALYLDGTISRFHLPMLDMNSLEGDFVSILAITKSTGVGESAGTPAQGMPTQP